MNQHYEVVGIASPGPYLDEVEKAENNSRSGFKSALAIILGLEKRTTLYCAHTHPESGYLGNDRGLSGKGAPQASYNSGVTPNGNFRSKANGPEHRRKAHL